MGCRWLGPSQCKMVGMAAPVDSVDLPRNVVLAHIANHPMFISDAPLPARLIGNGNTVKILGAPAADGDRPVTLDVIEEAEITERHPSGVIIAGTSRILRNDLGLTAADAHVVVQVKLRK